MDLKSNTFSSYPAYLRHIGVFGLIGWLCAAVPGCAQGANDARRTFGTLFKQIYSKQGFRYGLFMDPH